LSAQAVDIPIIGDSNQVPQDDPEYTLNMYAEKVSEEVYTLKPTPGSELYNQFTINGGGRGILVVAGRLFGVRGSFFQEIVDGTPVLRGTLDSSDGKVAMIFNLPPSGNGQILIVDDSEGYVFTLLTDAFTTLTGVGGDNFIGGGSQAAFCAGRAFVFKPGTTYFQCSGLYDFLSWDTTANATATSLNNPLLALASNGDLLYLFSVDGFEVWQDQGQPVLPVRQILSGDKIGLLAPNTAIFIERYCYWLGANSEGRGVVYRHSGGAQPERVSNHSTERQIAKLDSPSDCIGMSYNALGHVFYLLTFRSGNKTLVLDKTTKLWHDRAQRDPNTGDIFALPFLGIQIFGSLLLGVDYRDGKVWKIDDNLFTDAGNPIRRDRILSVTPKEGDYLTYFQSAELFGQIGNTPVGGTNPNIMLRYSIDRGETWSFEDWQQAGGNGSYEGRTRWVGLGAAYGLALWFRTVAIQSISWRMVRLRTE